MEKIDWNERIENDVKMYLDFSEHIIDYDFEWNNGKTNYDGWRDLYLDSVSCSDDEHLLERFGTTDKELIYDTINENIVMFNKIVKWTYEGYMKKINWGNENY